MVGVIGAELVGDPARFGLDAAFPALFLALLAHPAEEPEGRSRPRCSAAAIALTFVPFTATGVPLLLASLACLIGLKK